MSLRLSFSCPLTHASRNVSLLYQLSHEPTNLETDDPNYLGLDTFVMADGVIILYLVPLVLFVVAMFSNV